MQTEFIFEKSNISFNLKSFKSVNNRFGIKNTKFSDKNKNAHANKIKTLSVVKKHSKTQLARRAKSFQSRKFITRQLPNLTFYKSVFKELKKTIFHVKRKRRAFKYNLQKTVSEQKKIKDNNLDLIEINLDNLLNQKFKMNLKRSRYFKDHKILFDTKSTKKNRFVSKTLSDSNFKINKDNENISNFRFNSILFENNFEKNNSQNGQASHIKKTEKPYYRSNESEFHIDTNSDIKFNTSKSSTSWFLSNSYSSAIFTNDNLNSNASSDNFDCKEQVLPPLHHYTFPTSNSLGILNNEFSEKKATSILKNPNIIFELKKFINSDTMEDFSTSEDRKTSNIISDRNLLTKKLVEEFDTLSPDCSFLF